MLVLLGCGGFGFKIAAFHMKEINTLRKLTGILDYMECELQYRATPLPLLCRQAAGEVSGVLSCVFLALAQTFEDHLSPNVSTCMDSVLKKYSQLPELSRTALEQLGQSLGRFDIEGQLKGLEAVRQTCRRMLEELERNKDVRLRGYQTLGLCAGAALAIIFL
ncbi:MAG: stage III sporulation protein AB [Oscillospiraceae bacterium]|nr:stage III sporulation protein AB [Oscillospiraceae bacterium]